MVRRAREGLAFAGLTVFVRARLSVFMVTLFLVEVYAFMSTTVETSVMLDTNSETQLRINFNITLMDLSCDYAAIDVVDVLGTNSMNVTSNIEKWQLDENGVRMIFQGRNREQKTISHDEHHPDIEVRNLRWGIVPSFLTRCRRAQALHENGVHAIPLSQDNFDTFLEENPYVFVNFVSVHRMPSQRSEGYFGRGVGGWRARSKRGGARGGGVCARVQRRRPRKSARAHVATHGHDCGGRACVQKLRLRSDCAPLTVRAVVHLVPAA